MTGGMQRGDSLKSQQSHQVSDIIVGHRQVLRDPQLREKLLAEFVGTFFLVLAVGISVVGGGAFVAIAIGLVLSVQIYTFGAVSGGFFNPAVTLAVLLCGRQKITGREAALYAVVQTLAGIVAGFCAFAASGSTFCFDYRSTRGWGASVELEVFFTMALCGTVLAAGTSNDAPNHYFGFAIGMTVTGGALASGGFNQGSFNPAVTAGINIANYANAEAHNNPNVGSWFLFVLAPVFGGVLAAAVFRGTRVNEYAAFKRPVSRMASNASMQQAAPAVEFAL